MTRDPNRPVRSRILGLAVALVAVAACSVAQVGSLAPSLPSATPLRASQTPDPNQVALSSRSPGPSAASTRTAAPTTTVTAAPSPSPLPSTVATVEALHVDPALEALLPARIGDATLIRGSAAGASFPGGGDMCGFVCPEEPRLLAEAVGATRDDMTVAYAYDQVGGRQGRYLLVAFRVRGVSGAQLRAGRISLYHPDPPYPIVGDVPVAGRTVTVAIHWWAPNSTEFMVVKDDALIMIVAGAPEDTTGKVSVPDAVATVVKALP